MPCFRCAARQSDPVRGVSPWRRGVVAGYQVLICPACQQSPGWADVLDRCEACGSTHLVKALGTVTCRTCRAEVAGAGSAPGPPPAGAAGRPGETIPAVGDRTPGLADEVAAALDRVLRLRRPRAARERPGSA